MSSMAESSNSETEVNTSHAINVTSSDVRESTRPAESSLLSQYSPVTSQENTDLESLPGNSETQLVIPSTAGQFGVDIGREVVITGGTYHGACFGPQTSTQVIKAKDYRNATIINHNHFYAGDEGRQNEASTSIEQSALTQTSGDDDEEPARLSDTISMFSKQPLRQGTRIYKGIQKHISGFRHVAIKLVAFDSGTLREVKNLLKLSYHQNVIQIIESQECRSTVREIYIAMEMCSTQNLQDHINEKREQRIPLNFCLTMSYTKQLVAGIGHIHANGIVHRDLKPANILLSEDKKTLKVSDFGLSKELPPGDTSTNISNPGQGTNGFRAPETYISGIISLSADIYCLGLIFFILWSNGKHPFGEEIDLLNYNIKKNLHRDLSGVMLSGIKREEFLDLIERMLHPDPHQRLTIDQVSQHAFFTNSPSPAIEDSSEQGNVASPSEEVVMNQALMEQLDTQDSSERVFSVGEETIPKSAFFGETEIPTAEPGPSDLQVLEEPVPPSSAEELGNEVDSKKTGPDGAFEKPSSENERIRHMRPTPPNKKGWVTASEHQRLDTSVLSGNEKGASPNKINKEEMVLVRSKQPNEEIWVAASEHEERAAVAKSRGNEPKGGEMATRPKEFGFSYYDSDRRAEPQRRTCSHAMEARKREKEHQSFSPRQRRATSELHRNRSRNNQAYGALSPSPAAKNMTFSFSSNLRGRLDRLGLNSEKFCEWRLAVRYKGKIALNKAIRDMHRGRRVFYGASEKFLTHSLQKVNINSEEILICRLQEIKLPSPSTFKFFSSSKRKCLGFAVWFDKKTSELRGASYGQTSLYFYDSFEFPMSKIVLSNSEEVCILSMKNYIEWLERRKIKGVSMPELQGPTLRTDDEDWQSSGVEIELFPCAISSKN